MNITIWGDYACPFCYMGETMLENVLKELNIEIANESKDNTDKVSLIFKAYELDPKAPAIPTQTMAQHFASEHDITEQEAENQMQHITKMASRNGLEYHLEGVKVCSTFDAHRLLKYAIDHVDIEKVMKLHFALFKANFTDNLMLSDHKVLADIAESNGLDRDEVVKMLSSNQYAEEVRKDEEEADKQDLEYIPYLLFDNGKVLQGVLSPGALKKAIAPKIN